ncbi:acetyl esterase/lipase [Breznakibacter xylanolyticus]|uniref:Acetyl esterase/lipase n=2 Tax=Breznakibacter xylanolyticus TaxID=990 RepID=A0A2W7NGP8_9BACT|nr:acetyl esterase/lipase [Breznakibacter xylanolyticus]
MKNAFILIFLAMMTTAWGQYRRIALWDGEVPGNKANVQVAEVNVNNRVSKVTRPELLHYKAVNGVDSLRPAIVIVPGGGYIREAIDHEGYLAAEWFARQGFEAFVLKYRLPDRELVNDAALVPLMDGQQAIYLVRSRAAEFGVDASRVGIIGFSAGGHLASSVSTMFSEPVNKQLKPADVRPDFSVLMYPVISMDTLVTHRGSRDNLLGKEPDEAMVARFSTDLQVSAQTPVTLMVHAIDDKAVPVANTERYAGNLFARGGNVTKVILPMGGHGFGFDPKRPVAYWTGYLKTWLEANGWMTGVK